jgi:two-component system response regulator AtoC
MIEYSWPGNIRELAACVKKYVTTGQPEHLFGEEAVQPELITLEADEQPRLPQPQELDTVKRGVAPNKLVPLKEATRRAVEETERAMIEEALRQTLWNRRKAAKLLQVSYSSLLRRIDAYRIGKNNQSEGSGPDA